VEERGQQSLVSTGPQAFGEDVGKLPSRVNKGRGELTASDTIAQLVGVTKDVLRLLEGHWIRGHVQASQLTGCELMGALFVARG